MLLETRLNTSRNELSTADSSRRELSILHENLDQERVRIESIARELCIFSDVVTKRSEEVEYLFQLANETQEYAIREREKLDDETLRIATARKKAQTEKYMLVRERLELLRERSSVRNLEAVHSMPERKSINAFTSFDKQKLSLDPVDVQHHIFSSSALSNIKNAIPLPGLMGRLGPKTPSFSLASRKYERKSYYLKGL